MKKKEKWELGLNDANTRVLVSRMLFGLLGILGIIFIIIGTISLINEYEMKYHYVKTNGYVISNMETSDGMFIPTYSYMYGDKNYTVQADFAVLDQVEPGDKEVIYVNPENPKLAVVNSFNEISLFLVIGAMMLLIPLALYMIDEDSQKDDDNAILKAVMVSACGVLFYLVTGFLVGNYMPNVIWKYSALLVIMPAVFLIMGGYALKKILKFKEEEKKKHRLRNFFKIKKAKKS